MRITKLKSGTTVNFVTATTESFKVKACVAISEL